MLKFVLKAIVSGVVVYGVVEALHRTKAADRAAALADAVTNKFVGIVPMPFAKDTTADKPFETTDLRTDYTP